MKKFAVVVLIGGVVITWLALLVGWWWLTPILGLLIGIFLHPAGVGFLISLCVNGLGWGLPLAILAMNTPVKSVANAVESVVGLPSTGGMLIIIITITLGCILGMIGTWVGIAATQLFQRT